jgi:hypothetical protein
MHGADADPFGTRGVKHLDSVAKHVVNSNGKAIPLQA